MNEIKFLILLVVLVLLIMIGAYSLDYWPIRLSATSLDMFATGLVALWVAHKLRLNYIRKKNIDQLRDFGLFFFFFSIMMFSSVFTSVISLFFSSQEMYSLILDWGYIIVNFFLFIGFSFLVRVPISLFKPKLKNYGTVFFLIVGTIGLILNIMRHGTVKLLASGIDFRYVDPLVAKWYVVTGGLVVVPSALYLLYRGIRRGMNRLARIRALLIGAGLVILMIGGPLHGSAKTHFGFLIADIFTFLGIATMAAGVFFNLMDTSEKNNDANSIKNNK